MSDTAINIDMDALMTDDDLTGKYLTFYIGEKNYGVELQHVLEIISIQSITTVPSTPHYVQGIINLRGRIVPVIEVRLKFGMEQKEYDERTCIIVLNIDEMYVGLIVDQVSEVLAFDSDALAPLPEIGSVNNNKYIKSIAQVKDKLVLNLDCVTFLSDDLAPTHF